MSLIRIRIVQKSSSFLLHKMGTDKNQTRNKLSLIDTNQALIRDRQQSRKNQPGNQRSITLINSSA